MVPFQLSSEIEAHPVPGNMVALNMCLDKLLYGETKPVVLLPGQWAVLGHLEPTAENCHKYEQRGYVKGRLGFL